MQSGTEGLAEILIELAVNALGAVASLAPAFSKTSTYNVGAYVTYEGRLYKCKTQISTAGAWDATKWDAKDLATAKADAV